MNNQELSSAIGYDYTPLQKKIKKASNIKETESKSMKTESDVKSSENKTKGHPPHQEKIKKDPNVNETYVLKPSENKNSADVSKAAMEGIVVCFTGLSPERRVCFSIRFIIF